MSLILENVYSARDNVIDLVLTEDGTTMADHSVITRIVLELGAGETFLSAAPHMTIDSSVNSEYFDLTQTDKIVLKLGDAGIPIGRHITKMSIYTPTYPDGATWEPWIELDVK